jgi:hypothetical protein
MKWEYCFTTFSDKRDWVLQELNKLGNDEWEALLMMRDGRLLMKRPKPASASGASLASDKAHPQV